MLCVISACHAPVCDCICLCMGCVLDQGGMCEVLQKDLYAVLGARPSDSALQLKHRYQQLALQVNTHHSAQHHINQWSANQS